MDDGHERYRQLAVSHVLGGLDPDDAAAFRSHLQGCRDCRARVAELRGIASDLERAERDERARATVQTEVVRRPPEGEPEATAGGEPTGPRIGVRQVTIAAVIVMLLAGAMAFWNLHLRTTNAVVVTVAEQHADTLEVLAAGTPVDVVAEHPVRGLAAVDGERVALTLTGVEATEGARLVAWLRDGADVTPVAELQRREVGEGSVALVVEDRDADVLEITVERGELGQRARGEQVASVRLRGR
jgi:anti-sigma-K factor RskA